MDVVVVVAVVVAVGVATAMNVVCGLRLFVIGDNGGLGLHDGTSSRNVDDSRCDVHVVG